ncbi:MAG: Peptidoglycan-binding LysM [Pedosphaera sp.]|nr:Peptidoglycan-binding LysM [Pedosphaera sp.]
MKRIFFLTISCLLCAAPWARAQQDPTPLPLPTHVPSQESEENYKSLKGQVQDLSDARDALEKRLQAMAKEIAELREQASKPTGNYASPEDLKRLADTVQEIDKKREADKDLILKELGKLGKVVAAPATHVSTKPPVADPPTPTKADDGNGYNYAIKEKDTISLIAQAYRQQGVKVTAAQIIEANPGLNPNKLIVGKKIFIPAPKTAAAK